ncbi:hypothetical protein D9758_001615 [Tetrapyrgos nigripes]|uniref:Small ribosomal subunit protein mS33 n=1 Tax=Tetrapyrgos nigripes TaxID=182062 RepID=A0A8H5GXV3_9AGAR|nr:hypothetical protein D9758_001615 [Tetrapyrgos nigripes]
MSIVLPSRIAKLNRLRCTVFQTIYNPTSIRTGAKYLRARLRGPSMMDYYPPVLNLSKVAREYPELEIWNEDEEQRFRDVEDRKKRGKGAPKKARTKGMVLHFYCMDLTHYVFLRGRKAGPKKEINATAPPWPLATIIPFDLVHPRITVATSSPSSARFSLLIVSVALLFIRMALAWPLAIYTWVATLDSVIFLKDGNKEVLIALHVDVLGQKTIPGLARTRLES